MNFHRSQFADIAFVERQHPYGGPKVVTTIPVPSYGHWIIASAAVLDGSYCPSCVPSIVGGGPTENQFTGLKHMAGCVRTKRDL